MLNQLSDFDSRTISHRCVLSNCPGRLTQLFGRNDHDVSSLDTRVSMIGLLDRRRQPNSGAVVARNINGIDSQLRCRVTETKIIDEGYLTSR